jgi:hypothetical protein
VGDSVGFTFPVCFDASQSVAKAFTAACTPDPFLFDEKRLLCTRPVGRQPSGKRQAAERADIRAALDVTLAGKPVDPCSGRAPAAISNGSPAMRRRISASAHEPRK